MTDVTMPCEDCEQGQSSCCRLVYARDIEAVLPEECWVFKSEVKAFACARMIGGKFDNGATWTEEMCCLPCRVRLVIERTATIP
jgi:hypothetical protein